MSSSPSSPPPPLPPPAGLSPTDDTTKPYSSPTFDWASYNRYRPVYPASLFNLIYSHHTSHGNGAFELAHDAGCGSGIAASHLASRFSHVVLSDPSAQAIASAERNLTTHPSPNENKPKFTFHCASAEAMPSLLSPSSVDLVTIGEAIHWTQPDDVVRAAATVLKTGGTLAIWYYTGRPAFVDNSVAGAIFDEVMERWAVEGKQRGSESEKSLFISNTGLDCVGFHSDDVDNGDDDDDDSDGDGDTTYKKRGPLFEKGVRRVRINVPAGTENAMFALVKSKDHLKAESCVGKDDGWEERREIGDWEAVVDVEWLQGYLQSPQPTIPTEACQDLWERMEEALGGQGQGGKTRVVWPTVLLLATRR